MIAFKKTEPKPTDPKHEVVNKPDPTWWHNTGMEWQARYGEEMLGEEF